MKIAEIREMTTNDLKERVEVKTELRQRELNNK